MVTEKDAHYAVERMRNVLLNCPELQGIVIPQVDHELENLERFYKELLARHRENEGR